MSVSEIYRLLPSPLGQPTKSVIGYTKIGVLCGVEITRNERRGRSQLFYFNLISENPSPSKMKSLRIFIRGHCISPLVHEFVLTLRLAEVYDETVLDDIVILFGDSNGLVMRSAILPKSAFAMDFNSYNSFVSIQRFQSTLSVRRATPHLPRPRIPAHHFNPRSP